MAKGWRYSLTFRGHTCMVPEGQSVLGRSRQADIQISEPSVSRKHLRVVTVHDALVVEDLGASNGTYVNDAPIYGRTTVRHGDRLAIGDAELEVTITPIGASDSVQPVAGHGEATMFLQQQSVDLARQVESGNEPVNEISPEEALEALGEDLEKDERPSLTGEEVSTAAATPIAPSIPTAPAMPPHQPATSSAFEEAGPFATMAIDRSLFADLESPPKAPAAAATGPREPESTSPPWHEEPTPSLEPTLDSAFDDDVEEEIAAGTDLPAPQVAPTATASTAASSGWDAIAFDAIETPPPVANPAPPARPAISPLPAAGLGSRAAAWLIDLVWIAGFGGVFWLFLGLGSDPQGWQRAALLGLGCGALVSVAGWSLVGTTPGKRTLGLFVCTLEGQPGIGFLRATIRGTVWVLSVLTLGIGFLMALRPGGRALHDRVAGTYVGHRKG